MQLRNSPLHNYSLFTSFARFALATLAAALRDFYGEYEDDPRGSGYLWLELRA